MPQRCDKILQGLLGKEGSYRVADIGQPSCLVWLVNHFLTFASWNLPASPWLACLSCLTFDTVGGSGNSIPLKLHGKIISRFLMHIGKVPHFGTNAARSLDRRCLRISLHRKLYAISSVELNWKPSLPQSVGSLGNLSATGFPVPAGAKERWCSSSVFRCRIHVISSCLRPWRLGSNLFDSVWTGRCNVSSLHLSLSVNRLPHSIHWFIIIFSIWNGLTGGYTQFQTHILYHIIWSCFTKCHQYPMYLAFIPLSIPINSLLT